MPGLAFDSSLGALLIGGLLANALWGITCIQMYNFFNKAVQDTPIIRLLIAFLLALDTFDSALICHILYHDLVTNYTNPLALLKPLWSMTLRTSITSISTFIVKGMFIRQIYRLSDKNYILSLCLIILSLADLVAGLVITIKSFSISSFLEINKLAPLLYLNYASSTTSDLAIAIVLSYVLHKSRTGFERTDSIVNVLMVYTVNTGLIVGLDASAGMICYIVMPDNYIFVAFYLVQSKLYLNCFLASLNAREGLREKVANPLSINLSSISQSRHNYGHESSLPSAIEKGNQTDVTLIPENRSLYAVPHAL